MKTRICRLSVDKVTLIHSSIRSGSVNETMSVIRGPNDLHPHLIHAGRAERAAVIPPSGPTCCEINNNADPSLNDTLSPCWFNDGPASVTLVQQLTNIGSIYRACLNGYIFCSGFARQHSHEASSAEATHCYFIRAVMRITALVVRNDLVYEILNLYSKG